MQFDETFFVFLALVLFGLGLWYLGVHKVIGGALDKRSKAIADELDAARNLREESQALLAQYQRKQREAEKEAEDIIKHAQAEAERLKVEAEAALAAQLERRTKQAEEKIAQAEASALQQVRNMAVDVAIGAAQRVIQDQVDVTRAGNLIDSSISDLSSKLN